MQPTEHTFRALDKETVDNISQLSESYIITLNDPQFEALPEIIGDAPRVLSGLLENTSEMDVLLGNSLLVSAVADNSQSNLNANQLADIPHAPMMQEPLVADQLIIDTYLELSKSVCS
jgi:hypothetical protein